MTRKKLILGMILACGAAILGISACNEGKSQLEKPRDLLLNDEEILSWTCEGATSYAVSVNDTEFFTEDSSIDLFDIMIEPGTEYHIKVSAFADLDQAFDSEWSEELIYEVPSTEGKFTYHKIDGENAYKIVGEPSLRGKVIVPAEYNGLPVTRVYVGALANDFCGFRDLTEITGIYFPDSFTSIGGFQNCTSLARVRLPETLKKIDYPAFKGCTALRKIVLPSDLEERTSLGRCFFGCDSLESITVDPANPFFRSENNCVIRNSDDAVVLGCKTSVIPASARKIDGSAFEGCYGLTEIDLPDSLESVYYSAFHCCKDLKRFHLPASVEVEMTDSYSYIDDDFAPVGNLFYGCDALEEVTVEEGHPTLEAENNCVILKSDRTLIAGCPASVIPNDVKTIGIGAFQGVAGLGDLDIPYGVERIAQKAFSECFGLTMLRIPDSVTTIGPDVTKYSFDLLSVIIPESVTTIYAGAFGKNVDGMKPYAGSKMWLYTPCTTAPENWLQNSTSSFNYGNQNAWDAEIAYDGAYPYVTSINTSRNDAGRFLYLSPSSSKLSDVGISAPPRKGYRFEGWAAEPNGPVVYAAADEEHKLASKEEEEESIENNSSIWTTGEILPEIVGSKPFDYRYTLRVALKEAAEILPATCTRLYAVYTKL